MSVPQVGESSIALAKQYDTFTPEQVSLIHNTIMPHGTNYDQMAMFLHQCHRTGLDPLARQIYALNVGGKLSIQVGIDGFRAIAERSGEMDGREGPFYAGPDGQWTDAWFGEGPPAAAKVTIYRKGQSRGYMAVALWNEYGKNTGVWRSMPSLMLAKCAEALALRQAFPADLSGLYTADEMGNQPPQQDNSGGGQPAGRPVEEPTNGESTPPPAPTPVEEDVPQEAAETQVPGPDEITYLTMPRDAKVTCSLTNTVIRKGDEVAHCKMENGEYFVAHKQAYLNVIEDPDEPIEAEFEEVPEEEAKHEFEGADMSIGTPANEPEPAPKPKKKAAAKKKKASAKKKKKTAAQKAEEERNKAVAEAQEKLKKKTAENPPLRKLVDEVDGEAQAPEKGRDDSDLPF